MLTRTARIVMAGLVLVMVVVVPVTAAAGDSRCPPGTRPVSRGSGAICLVATDPGQPGNRGHGGSTGGGGHGSAGCFTSAGAKVPCRTQYGWWWSAYQCYAAPFHAPPGSPQWRGHTDGSLWQCTRCRSSGGAGVVCKVQIIWTPPGQEPGPPSPAQLAASALGMLPLARARVQTAPAPPAATYVGVRNWLWIPVSQWATLSKSVSAGGTTVAVRAVPTQLVWTMGPSLVTCYGPGRRWVHGMTDAARTTCGYAYRVTSDREPDGRFPITARIRYQVRWVCTGACSASGGDLGLVDAPAGASTMRVLQRQTVVVR